jgi:hypothetical protein
MFRTELLLLILFVLLLIANVWYFLARDWESSYFPANYATLYYPKDIPAIESWHANSLREIEVKINWNQTVAAWRVTCDGENPQVSQGMRPIIQLRGDELQLHTYTLTPLPEGSGPEIQNEIRFITKEFYAARGMKHTNVYTLKPSCPVGKFPQYSVDDWTDDYHYVGEKNLAEADRILREDVGIQAGEPTFAKMEKLAGYLRRELINARGVPKDDFRWMNPFLIFQEMQAGTGKGWCTQHGQIWVFFANRAGIPTRLLLGSRTQGNQFLYTGHTWAESFIAEQGRWAYVDLSHSHIYITDKNGLVLNTAELMHLNQHDAFDSTFARIYKDWEWKDLPGETSPDSVTTVPFSLCNSVVKGEFPELAIIKYRRPPNVEDVRTIYSDLLKDATYGWGNLERYLFKPPLAYSFYPTEGARTYWIRWSLLYSLVGVLAALVGTVVFRRLLG